MWHPTFSKPAWFQVWVQEQKNDLHQPTILSHVSFVFVNVFHGILNHVKVNQSMSHEPYLPHCVCTQPIDQMCAHILKCTHDSEVLRCMLCIKHLHSLF
jgi:hypothetical protein